MALSFKQVDPLSLVNVLHQACEETPEYKGNTSIESCTKALPEFDCYAINLDGEVIGGVIFKGNIGHIAVLRKYRKQWAGREFYRFMKHQSDKRGVIQAKAGTETGSEFIKVLEKRGFVCFVN